MHLSTSPACDTRTINSRSNFGDFFAAAFNLCKFEIYLVHNDGKLFSQPIFSVEIELLHTIDRSSQTKMSEMAQRKVQDSVSTLMDDLDKNHLRQMQVRREIPANSRFLTKTFQMQMHKCAADCCGNTKSSATQVQQCIDRCQDKIQVDLESFLFVLFYSNQNPFRNLKN